MIADREFVGKDWVEYLLREQIAFFLRLPKHYWFTVNGVALKAEHLLQTRKECKLDNIAVLALKGLSVGMKKVKNKQGQAEYLIVLTNTVAYEALRTYRKRWSIEVLFEDFKSQGFNLEDTHLKEAYKLKKLVYLVSLAYAFCVHVGFYHEKHVKPIPKKKHGYRSKSLFRKGLDLLRTMIERKKSQHFQFWHTLVDSFVHLAMVKLLYVKRL